MIDIKIEKELAKYNIYVLHIVNKKNTKRILYLDLNKEPLKSEDIANTNNLLNELLSKKHE